MIDGFTLERQDWSDITDWNGNNGEMKPVMRLKVKIPAVRTPPFIIVSTPTTPSNLPGVTFSW